MAIFFLNSKQIYKVARVRFIVREDADSVIVAANGETNSVIEVWELVENAYPVNSVFKKSVSLGVGPPAGDPGLKTITWRLQNSYAYEAKVLSVTTSKLCVSF
ncbi:mediator of RNA polymerase II transcription subunit 16-like [Diaphorina citri]|uniref:Mediator of RNA polymerase II transcription subunit 16 n=1 Tax=Diaphorina citri TaxID=121845 RepID=A0A3Q0IML2_DIACI|nr:mediator of RNA polymerase II transcription subunit 16-like [Diaphorina citri]